MALLHIKNLSILKANKPLISKSSFSVLEGESVGLYGRSGSGKSVFSLFLLGLLNTDVFSVSADSAVFSDDNRVFNLLSKKEKEWDFFRQNSISMVFQDPSVALNPTITCGKQVEECLFGVVEKKEIVLSFLERWG